VLCSFFCYVNVLVFYVLGLTSYGVVGELVFGLGVVYHLKYSMLCVVSVVIVMTIGVDIGTHNKCKMTKK